MTSGSGGGKRGGEGSPGSRFDQTVDLDASVSEANLDETVVFSEGATKRAATPFEQSPEDAAAAPPELAEALARRDQVTAQAAAAFEDMQRMVAETMAAAKSRFEGNSFDLSGDAGRARALAKIMITPDDGLEALAEQCRGSGAHLEAEQLRQLRDALRVLGGALAAPKAEGRERIAQVVKTLGVTS